MGMATLEGLGSAGLQGWAKYKQDSVQYEVNEAARINTNKSALEALTTSYRSLEAEAEQIEENKVSNAIDLQKAAAQMRGEALSQSGASGTGGSGTDMVIQDINTEAARNTAKATINRERQLTQLDQGYKQAQATAKSRMNFMPSQKPSMASALLSTGAAGFRNVSALRPLYKAQEKL